MSNFGRGGFVIGGGGAKPGAGAAPGSSAIPFITEREFEAEVLRPQLPVLLYFTADWCQPCRTIGPEVEVLAKELEGKVSVRKVDIDKAPIIARELRIQSVPTFIVFVKGRPVDAVVGAVGKKKLRELVEPFLPRAEGALKAVEVAHAMREGAVVPVDTRDAAAFGRAHLPGAKHIPLEEVENRLAELAMLPAPPVLYCRSGDKTKELAAKLAEMEMPAAFLDGGLLAWEAEGLPIERG
jgi:thioredoxin 1/putative thioredoxin